MEKFEYKTKVLKKNKIIEKYLKKQDKKGWQLVSSTRSCYDENDPKDYFDFFVFKRKLL